MGGEREEDSVRPLEPHPTAPDSRQHKILGLHFKLYTTWPLTIIIIIEKNKVRN